MKYQSQGGMHLHHLVRLTVRLLILSYLVFLLAYQVHSPTTAIFTNSTTVNGTLTAGNYGEEENETVDEQESSNKSDQAMDEQPQANNETMTEAAQEETVNETKTQEKVQVKDKKEQSTDDTEEKGQEKQEQEPLESEEEDVSQTTNELSLDDELDKENKQHD